MAGVLGGWSALAAPGARVLTVPACLSLESADDYPQPQPKSFLSNIGGEPTAVAYDLSDNTYVCTVDVDAGMGAITKYSPSGERLITYGHLKCPIGVTLTSNDHAWVIDQAQDADPGEFLEFDASLRLIRAHALPRPAGGGQRPTAICTDASDRLYVTVLTARQPGQPVLYIFDVEGKLIRSLNKTQRTSDWDGPSAICVDSMDAIFLLRAGQPHVFCFDQQGKHLRTWGQPGTGHGKLKAPVALALDSGGQVLVADIERQVVMIFSERGEFQTEWGDSISPGIPPDSVRVPAGVAVAQGGDITVVHRRRGSRGCKPE